MDGWVDWSKKRRNEGRQVGMNERWINEWVDGWMNGLIEGKMDGWVDRWIDWWMVICMFIILSHTILLLVCMSIYQSVFSLAVINSYFSFVVCIYVLESTRSTLNGNVKTITFVHICQDIFEIVFEKAERNRLM